MNITQLLHISHHKQENHHYEQLWQNVSPLCVFCALMCRGQEEKKRKNALPEAWIIDISTFNNFCFPLKCKLQQIFRLMFLLSLNKIPQMIWTGIFKVISFISFIFILQRSQCWIPPSTCLMSTKLVPFSITSLITPPRRWTRPLTWSVTNYESMK